MQITGIADGVLSDRQMGMMIETGQITSEWDIEEGQVQPASLDLRLGAKAYRVRASFLPGRSATVSDRLNEFTMHEMDLRAGAVLEKG
ncbi:MAG: 2'-deoxycytidine 5'-triphosphate deaminase, partial [Paracoccaceae bacterium]